MSAERERVSQALILRNVAYGEADQVVTLLTQSDGKRSVFARSARKSKRRFAGGLEPMRLLEVRYRDKGPSKLALIIESRVLEGYDALVTDLHRLYWASLALEWTGSMTVEGEATPVFDTAVELFRWLAKETRGAWFVEAGCLRYGLVLLAHAGFLPELQRCVRTGIEIAAMQQPHFSSLGGGLLDESSVRPEDRAKAVSKYAIEFLSVLCSGRFPPDRDTETLREARDIVLHIFRAIVDGEPKSLGVLKTIWM